MCGFWACIRLAVTFCICLLVLCADGYSSDTEFKCVKGHDHRVRIIGWKPCLIDKCLCRKHAIDCRWNVKSNDSDSGKNGRHVLEEIIRQNISPEYLFLDTSFFNDTYNLSAFSRFTSLKELSLNCTRIKLALEEPMPRLEVLYLRRNNLSQFPETCYGENHVSYFPRLLQLDLSGNLIQHVPESVCFPTLQFLNLAENDIMQLMSNSFALWKFPSLLTLRLEIQQSDNYWDEDLNLQAYGINNSALQSLSMSWNYLFLRNGSISGDFFRGCLNLTTLDLSCKQTMLPISTMIQKCRLSTVLPNIQQLYTNGCYIGKVTNQTFHGFSSLRVLQLSRNVISHISDGAFATLKSLTDLDLSNNSIRVISENTFSLELREKLTRVDLSNNRLLCDCSMYWFQRWFVRREDIFTGSRESYPCSNLNNINMFTFLVSKQSCMFPRQTFVLIFGASLTLLLTMLAALALSVSWRLRNNIRLFVGNVTRKLQNKKVFGRARGECFRLRQLPVVNQPILPRAQQTVNVDETDAEYDVFVSYAEEDAGWVNNDLMPVLEGCLGLRLCLHHRDFHPGRRVLDNIDACVESSRKMMFVFSPHFAKSQWCQFELSLGLNHAMDRNEELLVVYLSEVPPEDLTSGMSAILRSCTYLRWAEQGQEAVRFWANIRAVLPSANRAVLPSANRAVLPSANRAVLPSANRAVLPSANRVANNV